MDQYIMVQCHFRDVILVQVQHITPFFVDKLSWLFESQRLLPAN